MFTLQALPLTFVHGEQDIPTPVDERRSYVTTQHKLSEPLHEHYSSHNVSHFPFQHITAFRADMTRRLEELNTRRTISLYLQEVLEVRLVIAFKEHDK